MSDIGFSSIPSDQIQPLFVAEVSNAKVAAGETPRRSLIIAQGLGTGFVAGVLTRVMSLGAVKTLCRAGSMAARMVESYLDADPLADLWLLPLADATSGQVKAHANLTITGTATADGAFTPYLGGRKLAVSVSAGNTAAQVAAKVVAALGVDEAAATALGSPYAVTASNVDGVITFTARNAGSVGNSIDIRMNYGGEAASEKIPDGLAVSELPTVAGESYIHLASGAGDPDLSTLGAMLGDQRFAHVANPYTASPALTKFATEFGDAPGGRWGYARRLYGIVFSALNSTASALAAFTTANDPHMSIFGIEGSPTPADEIAASYAGVCAASLRINPARPLNTLSLPGVKAPAEFDQFYYTDRDLILRNGITTPTIDASGNVRIQRAVTTYITNPYGAADKSYRDITTPATLDFLLTEMEALITNTYPRHILVSDGQTIGAGMPVVNPSAIKDLIIGAYQGWEQRAIVEDTATFAKLLRVQRNSQDSTRVDVLFPPDLANGLMVFAALAEFRLQYTEAEINS